MGRSACGQDCQRFSAISPLSASVVPSPPTCAAWPTRRGWGRTASRNAYLSNLKGAYTEDLVELLRKRDGWELVGDASHVNAPGYDRIVRRGDIVRLIEAKAREALRLDDIKNYVHRGQDGRLLFNVDYFRDHVSGALEPEQILRTGTLEVELFVNSSSLENSGEIVNALAREMGSDIGPGRIFAEYEVIIGGVEETRLVEILLTPISG